MGNRPEPNERSRLAPTRGGELDTDANRAASLWLPSHPRGAALVAPREQLAEGMTLMTFATFTFTDPLWGPITFRLFVYRLDQADLPEYHVVVE